MQRLETLEQYPVFMYLDSWQQQLVRLAMTLYRREQATNTHFLDYSFIVFPMAKAYEGFLKQYLLDLDLITNDTFQSKRFRIGRAMNPDVRPSQRDDLWLYDDLAEACGPQLARELWNTWLTCRNRVFHYFPDRESGLSLDQAGQYLRMQFDAMEKAFSCQRLNKESRIGHL